MIENKKTDYAADPLILKKIAQLYAPHENFTDSLVSPLYGDVAGLPPIQLQASTTELLRDDSVRFYEKFKDEIEIELELCENTPHCHQIYGFLPESKASRIKIRNFINKHCPL